MAVRKAQIINQTLDDPAFIAASGALDLNGTTPKRITLMLSLVKTGSPPNLDLIVYVSPNGGNDLIRYNKLITDAGEDTPKNGVVYSQSWDDVLSLSKEDVVDYIQVNLSLEGDTIDAYDNWDIKAWLVIDY